MKRLALALIAASFVAQGASESQTTPNPAFSICYTGEVRSHLYPCG
ncbi:MAG: hypothetical protein AB1714_18580 [Acidobacteriota bacterium]